MVEVKVDAAAIVEKLKRLATNSQKSRALLATIGAYMQREVIRTFGTQGARIGRRWAPLAASTKRTPAGTRKLSYGTDKQPRRTESQLAKYRAQLIDAGLWKIGKVGYMPGYEGQRRYSDKSKPLYVSGNLRQSFQVRQLDNHRVTVASRYPTRMLEGIVKKRKIMKFTVADRKIIRKLTVGFINAAFSTTASAQTVKI